MRLKLSLAVTMAALLVTASSSMAAGPAAIGTDSDGTSYAGFASGAVKRHHVSDGASIGDWTTPKGDANGSLGGIMAIDVGPGGGGQNGGNVWVLDKNRRVQEFTRSGNFIRGFRLSTFCSQSNEPIPGTEGGIDVSFDSIYVSHPCNNRVERYRLSDLPANGSATVNPVATANVVGPHGIAAQLWGSAPGSTQRVYVAQPSSNSVVRLGLNDLSAQGSQSVHSPPADVFVDEFGVLFVSTRHGNDASGDRIYQYDQNGSEFRWVGGPGADPGRFNDPLAFDVFPQFSDAAGNLFIADTGNERVQRMNPFGWTFWAAPAQDPGVGQPPPQNPPQNTAAPQIQGTATENNQVTCTNGTWTNSPTTFTFQWNRNGNPIGGAETNTYTLQNADVGQQITCTVTASNAAGSSQATSDAVTPTAAPPVPSGPVGVSINSAAIFTNSTSVTLTIHEPTGASQVQISNDGGFSSPDTRGIAGDDTYSWTLASSGAERLPKTVYVRFLGAGIDETQTYTDDIVLDESAPNLMAATLTQGGDDRAAGRGAKWVLRVRARDDNSGLALLGMASKKRGNYKTRPFTKRLTVSSPRKVRYVQLTDKAGNTGPRVEVKRRRH